MKFESINLSDVNNIFINMYDLQKFDNGNNPLFYMVDDSVLREVSEKLFDVDDLIISVTFIYDKNGLRIYVVTTESEYDHLVNECVIDRMMDIINHADHNQMVDYVTMILTLEP